MRSLMGQRYAESDLSQQEIETSSDSLDENRLADFTGGTPQYSTRKAVKSSQLTIGEQMFQAGLFSEEQRVDFRRLQIVLPIGLGMAAGGLGLATTDVLNTLLYVAVGAVVGSWLPLNRLSKWTQERNEEILFYLPLVIEQISIGVSSSLDIGPCLARVVQMADERDSHNPVTELLRFAQGYIKSGVSLQEALNEVARKSGNNEVLHAFKALAQVARYGGEISKQLQDLSESVSSNRENKVEEKIKKLELSATGPVAMVFAGFLVILLLGFGTVVMGTLGS
jgi:Flp pilus assembly protein TadB